MKLTEEQIKIIEGMSACNYNPQKIALYLDIDKKIFIREWSDQKSLVRYHYDRGQLVADFEIAKKRLQNAQSGNLTADQQHSKERERRRVEDLKLEILYCEPISTDDEIKRLTKN